VPPESGAVAPVAPPYPYLPPGASAPQQPLPPGYYPPPGYAPMAPDRQPEAVAEAPSAPNPGAHKHDGLFMQMQVGLGGFVYKPSPDRTPSGGGGGMDLAIGGALTPRLVLCGGTSVVLGETADSGPKYTSVLVGFSGNVVYYLEDNLFFGGGVGVGFINADEPTKNSQGKYTNIGTTGVGLFVKAQAGREWWVSDNWALGFSVRASFVRATEKDAGPYAPVWTGGTGSALFSATFN
jgi:hypothetical protein